MSGWVAAHKLTKCRTFLVRQWCQVRVDTGAAALMLWYKLDASREAVVDRCVGDFLVALGSSL